MEQWGRRETEQPSPAQTGAGDAGWERVTCLWRRCCGVSERRLPSKEVKNYRSLSITQPSFRDNTLAVTTWVCALSVGVFLRLSRLSMLIRACKEDAHKLREASEVHWSPNRRQRQVKKKKRYTTVIAMLNVPFDGALGWLWRSLRSFSAYKQLMLRRGGCEAGNELCLWPSVFLHNSHF